MRKRRPDEGAATRADRAASKGACLLLRRVAAGDGQRASQRQRQRDSFLHVSPVDSIERGADPVAVVIIRPLRALAGRGAPGVATGGGPAPIAPGGGGSPSRAR